MGEGKNVWKILQIMSTDQTNNYQFNAYKSKFGHPPKNATHLINFAKKNGVNINWKQATFLIKNATAQTPPSNSNISTKRPPTTTNRYKQIVQNNQFHSTNTNYPSTSLSAKRAPKNFQHSLYSNPNSNTNSFS